MALLCCGSSAFASPDFAHVSDRRERDLQVDEAVDKYVIDRDFKTGYTAGQIRSKWLLANQTVDVKEANRSFVRKSLAAASENRGNEQPSTSFTARLSEDGQIARQKVSMVINQHYEFIEFAPYLPYLLDTLLSFLSEEDTIFVLHCFLRRAKQRTAATSASANRLYAFFKYRDFEEALKHVWQTFMFVQENSPSQTVTGQPAKGPGFDPSTPDFAVDASSTAQAVASSSRGADYRRFRVFFARHFSKALGDLLPFGLFVRLTSALLFDGWKAVERMLIAVLLSVDFDVNKVHDEVELATKLSALCRRKTREIGKLAYSIKYTHDANATARKYASYAEAFKVDDLEQLRDLFFSRVPLDQLYEDELLNEPSVLGKLAALRMLINSVDASLALKNWSLVFRASEHGFSVRSLWRKLLQPRDAGMLILVKVAGKPVRGLLVSLFTRFAFELTAPGDQGRILKSFSREEVVKFSEDRFFVGSLLVIDGDMKQIDGSLVSDGGVILDLEVLVAN